MGVDYSGNYGIGVQIKRTEFEEEHKYYDDFLGYLEEKIDDAPYFYFEVGEGMYTGEENELYICIDNPFSNGYCGLEDKVNRLYSFLRANEIEWDGEVDVVGGLEVD